MKDRKEKILKKIKDIEEKYFIEEKEINFTILGSPQSYSRERKTSRGNHFYNPKTGKMNDFRKQVAKGLSKEDYNFCKNLISNNSSYSLSIIVDFFIKTPESDSLEKAALKEAKIDTAVKRPDIDNYQKFFLDSLHDVFYADDSLVSEIHARKFYSIDPRTEAKIIIKQIKEKEN